MVLLLLLHFGYRLAVIGINHGKTTLDESGQYRFLVYVHLSLCRARLVIAVLVSALLIHLLPPNAAPRDP